MANNLLNELIYIDYNSKTSLIQLKQGDVSPILIKLINNTGMKTYKSLKEYATERTDELAVVYLSTSDNTVVFRQSFDVKSGIVALTINQILPVGIYYLEIQYNGKIYPSDNSLSVKINPAADIAQEDIINLDTISSIENNIISNVMPQLEEKVDTSLPSEIEKYFQQNLDLFKGEKGDTGSIADTETWQKYKLTDDNGWYPSLSNLNLNDESTLLSLKPGNYYFYGSTGVAGGGIMHVMHNQGATVRKIIVYDLKNNDMYINSYRKLEGSFMGWQKINNTASDTGWLPVSLQNGFFNENEVTNKLSYRIVRNGNVGIINISGRIKTPNALTRGLKYIGSIPVQNDKSTALTAYASNYSGVSQAPAFSMFYENKLLTINTVTEVPANTVFDINGTTIINLT